jgi:1-acyl-sn-glycerol-3-phosphate acyltransferase
MRTHLSQLRPHWETFVPAFYVSANRLLRVILWIVARWTVEGRENVPAEGALIVVSNHLSNADPPILAAGMARRRVRYMAKVELFHSPLNVIVRLYGAFAVRRFDADVGALLRAERILKHGGVLGMFPEGHRSRSGFLGKPHPGTAMIALRSGATVIPCAIAGTEQLRRPLNYFRRPRIEIHIGEPIRIDAVRRPSEQQVSDLTERIFEAIKVLLPAKYLEAYTGSEGAADSEHGGDHPGE